MTDENDKIPLKIKKRRRSMDCESLDSGLHLSLLKYFKE
jgi:hypothetical protein